MATPKENKSILSPACTAFLRDCELIPDNWSDREDLPVVPVTLKQPDGNIVAFVPSDIQLDELTGVVYWLVTQNSLHIPASARKLLLENKPIDVSEQILGDQTIGMIFSDQTPHDTALSQRGEAIRLVIVEILCDWYQDDDSESTSDALLGFAMVLNARMVTSGLKDSSIVKEIITLSFDDAEGHTETLERIVTSSIDELTGYLVGSRDLAMSKTFIQHFLDELQSTMDLGAIEDS